MSGAASTLQSRGNGGRRASTALEDSRIARWLLIGTALAFLAFFLLLLAINALQHWSGRHLAN